MVGAGGEGEMKLPGFGHLFRCPAWTPLPVGARDTAGLILHPCWLWCLGTDCLSGWRVLGAAPRDTRKFGSQQPARCCLASWKRDPSDREEGANTRGRMRDPAARPPGEPSFSPPSFSLPDKTEPKNKGKKRQKKLKTEPHAGT